MDDKAVYMLCGDGEFRLASNSLYIDRQRIRIAMCGSEDAGGTQGVARRVGQTDEGEFQEPRQGVERGAGEAV